jgi:hypothetical protein
MLGDAQVLTKALRDGPRNNKLKTMALALDTRDVEAMEAIIAAPLSTFNDAVNFQRFQTQTADPGSSFRQKENIDPRRARKSTTKSSVVKLEQITKAGKSKCPTGIIDLTLDSDGEPPDTGLPPTKSKGVIDLTGDEHVVLFRSPRAIEIQDD